MKLYAAIMLGGALGSAARFALSVWVGHRIGEEFPWGTFAVNVIGSFVIGLVAGLTGPGGPLLVPEAARVFVLVGVLGGFTTFSSFTLQTMMLLQDGQWWWATGNVVLSVFACLLATAAGLALVNLLPFKS